VLLTEAFRARTMLPGPGMHASVVLFDWRMPVCANEQVSTVTVCRSMSLYESVWAEECVTQWKGAELSVPV
jgi:hypothetical protein